LQPVYQQLKALRSELEQLPALKSELAELKKQVADMGKLEQKVVTLTTQMEQMRAQSAAITALGAEFKQFKEADTVAMHSRPNPSTPRLQSPAPSKSRRSVQMIFRKH
jgi:prefoldin subunit 5